MIIRGTKEELTEIHKLLIKSDKELKNVRIEYINEISCYKCEEVQLSTQRFCVECGTCLT